MGRRVNWIRHSIAFLATVMTIVAISAVPAGAALAALAALAGGEAATQPPDDRPGPGFRLSYLIAAVEGSR